MNLQSLRIALVLASISPLSVYAQVRDLTYGDRTSPNGTKISVEEDFMDGRYPRHVIVLSHEGIGDQDGRLILRCQSNSSEVYFVSGPFDFFGQGQEHSILMRFPSDNGPRNIPLSLSTDGEAVFFPDPISIMSQLATDGSVGISGRYYGGSFRHNIVLDRETQAAIYDLAQTCEWEDRLPVIAVEEPKEDNNPQLELVSELNDLIDRYGIDAVKEFVDDY